MDLYKVLDLEKSADSAAIKKAYRKMAMKYHPDRTGGDLEAEKKFKEVNQAYEILSDEAKRSQYDRFGSTNGAAGGSPFGGWFQSGWVDVDLWDIFESFFGGWFSGNNRQKRTEFKGEDLEYPLNIDLKTSIYGGKEKITFHKKESCTPCDGAGGSDKKTCDKCSWNGQVTYSTQSMFGTIQQTGVCGDCEGSGETFGTVCSECHGQKRQTIKKDISIDIPAGIDDGMIIKMTSEWNHGVGTNAHGDLYIKFTVNTEEKGLSRDGVDLHYDLEIDVLEAILGTKKSISIPVLGKRSVEIKSGTQSQTIIKITGDGVKHINSESKGDLYIKILVKIPKKLSKSERELYENIATEKKIDVNKSGVFEKIFG